MNALIKEDLVEMGKKFSLYIEKGRVTGPIEVREEPMIALKPSIDNIKPLRKISNFKGQFWAVDCSTRTLKRANNWGIYLMRTTSATLEGRSVNWDYAERICSVVGDAYTRSNYLTDFRIELESQMALRLLDREYYEDPRSIYLLLDGGGYFGGERKFRVALYDECKKKGINLLAISKNSPLLHDDKGRDFIATTSILSPYGIWVYHPIRKAEKDHSLYGDISIVKLCEESHRIFRCDIMDYLTTRQVNELLSPLTFSSEDPRCMGYPIALWLAHEFSAPSVSMLLHYHDLIEKELSAFGLLDVLRREELTCRFVDEIHGIRYAYQREFWGDYV
ncbi:DNA double-strand break repair nuclease NurA [Candidatus Bathyarchaeota archaeon]|nr:DNA double-strand break repair nuclease NurA [Candidatus Bathyarchaeota archaeon]